MKTKTLDLFVGSYRVLVGVVYYGIIIVVGSLMRWLIPKNKNGSFGLELVEDPEESTVQ